LPATPVKFVGKSSDDGRDQVLVMANTRQGIIQGGALKLEVDMERISEDDDEGVGRTEGPAEAHVG
jgi:hypothetical protein